MDNYKKLLYKYNKYKYKYVSLKKQNNVYGNVHPASIGSSIKHENFIANTFHPASIKK
jgi:hypothetical protein